MMNRVGIHSLRLEVFFVFQNFPWQWKFLKKGKASSLLANGFHLCVKADWQVVVSIVSIPIAYLTLGHQEGGMHVSQEALGLIFATCGFPNSFPLGLFKGSTHFLGLPYRVPQMGGLNDRNVWSHRSEG